jgi:DNA topoisomerase-1
MAKKLVIVESPAKTRTINKILGKDYIVKSSMGHVRDLPVKTLGVDLDNGFEPSYVTVKGRKKVIDELKKAFGSCDEVYLAPDPDREGEAIAWHLQALLTGRKKKVDKEFYRVQYNEITARAVKSAFESRGSIDMNRVNAQQARRILDRIVGYKVSPVLWQRIRRGLSAGRVQSVALRLVCEREDEIDKFVPQEYWIMGATARKLVDPRDPFDLRLIRIEGKKAEIHSSERAEEIRSDLESRKLVVSEIQTKEVKRRPRPPYITSTLQQAGSSYCGFSPKRTMGIAQKLYEGVDLGEGPTGLITYMRTDSFSLSNDALGACRDFIKGSYGDEFCPEKPNFYKSRSGAQEAHEAIRPTDVTRTPESLKGTLEPAEMKLYKLIWERFVACQMKPALISVRTVKVNAEPDGAKDGKYILQATTSEVAFPGYMKVAGTDLPEREKDGKEKEKEEQKLPPLNEGEGLDCMKWNGERKETTPPSRYSEASLVRALEQNGVGRPSTYAQIISTLYNREYIAREKKSISPTDLGRQVSKLLVSDLGELFDVHFTAEMEGALDEIEKGSVQWTEMLSSFYEKFSGWLKNAAEPPADIAVVKKVLDDLKHVTEWAAAVKRGKRTYSDEKFVASITKQVDNAKRPISRRQLEALVRLACKYREQIEGVEDRLRALGYGEFVDAPPRRAESGRALTGPQVNALDGVVMSFSDKIENFEAIKEKLDIKVEVEEEDGECAVMLKAMGEVKTWKDPVKRGRMVFDDKKFFESLSQHYSRRKSLSPKQKAALFKMVKRYRSQIPNAESIVGPEVKKEKKTEEKE